MKLNAKKLSVLAILLGAAIAFSFYKDRSLQKNLMPTPALAQNAAFRFKKEEPRESKSSAPSLKSISTEQGSATPLAITEKIKDIDVQIDILSREVRAAQKSVETGRIKEQLNSESLPPATRELYFSQLKELARLRRQVIELRFQKIEILHSAIDHQASRQLKVKS